MHLYINKRIQSESSKLKSARLKRLMYCLKLPGSQYVHTIRTQIGRPHLDTELLCTANENAKVGVECSSKTSLSVLEHCKRSDIKLQRGPLTATIKPGQTSYRVRDSIFITL